ncbi:MAG: LytR/AlgR family response regulator transcription factor [Luteibaculaceae bacterium]
MKPISVLIVDDEPQARVALRGILTDADFLPANQIIGEAKDIPEAVKAINALKPDLVLLDVEMPGYSGLELVKFFNPDEITFGIIFTTAYSEYAINAFELSAVDYLLKPIQPAQISKAINKFITKRGLHTPNLATLKANLAEPENPKIAIQVSEGYYMVSLNDIIYLKADGSYTEIHLTDKRKLTVTKKLLEYEKLEKYPQFSRIHRSHIVNLNRIKLYLKQDNGTVVMENDEKLSVSREKKHEVSSWWEENKI